MASETYKRYSVLFSSTLSFTVCFMIWMMLAVVGIKVQEEMGFNQTHPRADSRDVSLHPMTNKPPNQGGLFYWLAVWLILIPPIVVRVVVGVRDPDGVWEGRD